MLVTFGISRFDEVGSRVARVRQAATAEMYLREYIGYQNQVHDAFLRVQAADPASKRVEAMTAALVPSDQLPAALNGYIKNSLNLPGEAQARRDQTRLTAAYSKLARAAGPIIATSDAPASLVQERLAAVNAAYAKAIASQEKIITLYTDARRTEMARAAAIVADSRRKVELASVAGALFVLLLAAFAARGVVPPEREVLPARTRTPTNRPPERVRGPVAARAVHGLVRSRGVPRGRACLARELE